MSELTDYLTSTGSRPTASAAMLAKVAAGPPGLNPSDTLQIGGPEPRPATVSAIIDLLVQLDRRVTTLGG